MLSDVPRHGTYELARRRLVETCARRGDLRLPDLMHYLEQVTVEPAGDDAFRLAGILKDMRLNDAQLRQLLHEAQRWLRLRAIRDYRPQIQQWLGEAQHALDARPPAVPAPGELFTAEPAQGPADREELDRYSARVAGERIAGLILEEQRLERRGVFAALAVAWLFISPPPADTDIYMDQAVRDLFPW